MDTAWILIGSYLTPRERIILSRADRNLHSLFSSHTEIPHWCFLVWKEEEREMEAEEIAIKREIAFHTLMEVGDKIFKLEENEFVVSITLGSKTYKQNGPNFLYEVTIKWTKPVNHRYSVF